MADGGTPGLARPMPHHVALTVTSFETSIPWYEELFSIEFKMDGPHDGGVGKLLADEEWKVVIVLHEHDTNAGENFHETRTGLDHLGYGVPNRAELVGWQDRLEELGFEKVAVADRPLTQSPIADTPYGGILVFRDPDNIQLEFFSPPGT
jgi:glyoxylase I family protein